MAVHRPFPHCPSHDARVRPALLSHGARMRVRGLIASIRCLAGVDRSSCSSGKRFDLCWRRPQPEVQWLRTPRRRPLRPFPRCACPRRDGFARVASGSLRADRPLLLSCAQGPIMSEAVDKWVFDTFRQLFPPCGPGTPHQKKMLCGCDPTNPEHYVRLLEVDDALKAKDRDDGTVFTKGLIPSKIGAILARFGVQHKQSGINQDTCKARGFRHNSVPSGSALFGRKPIQGGACSGAASAAGAATAAASAVGSGATNPGGAANPGVAAALASGNGGGAAPSLAWAPVISLASGLAVQSAPSVAPAAESTVRAA